MRFKKLIGKIHLWLGLASGLVVFVVSITGAIYAFQEELSLLFQYGVYKNVEPQDRPFISPLEVRDNALKHFPGEVKSVYATVYPEGDRASIIWVRDGKRQYTAIVQNPYTGETVHIFPYAYDFWRVIISLHVSLMIPKVGTQIVSISTIIFTILLITGLVLWYPKKMKYMKNRLKIKWNASPKRLNYELHNVLGFYMTWVSIFIAISGLIMAYDWMDKSVYWLASGGEQPAKRSKIESNINFKSYDSEEVAENAIKKTIAKYDDLDNYLINFPMDSTGNYLVTLNTDKGFFYNRHDNFYIDQYTGKTLKTDLWKDKNNGERLQEANLNIHIGAILGLPGKFIAFFASLIAASLPITGFYIWYGRNYKKKPSRAKESSRTTVSLNEG